MLISSLFSQNSHICWPKLIKFNDKILRLRTIVFGKNKKKSKTHTNHIHEAIHCCWVICFYFAKIYSSDNCWACVRLCFISNLLFYFMIMTIACQRSSFFFSFSSAIKIPLSVNNNDRAHTHIFYSRDFSQFSHQCLLPRKQLHSVQNKVTWELRIMAPRLECTRTLPVCLSHAFACTDKSSNASIIFYCTPIITTDWCCKINDIPLIAARRSRYGSDLFFTQFQPQMGSFDTATQLCNVLRHIPYAIREWRKQEKNLFNL